MRMKGKIVLLEEGKKSSLIQREVHSRGENLLVWIVSAESYVSGKVLIRVTLLEHR